MQNNGDISLRDGVVRLSVVIPLHNALPYFKRTINSILNQSYDLNKVEIIVIDNGSTDGSGAYIDQVSLDYPGLFCVLHQHDSGGPSSPRNRGIERARGDYVFLCDADDYFGPEAFDRMVQHADEWNSDLLLVKVASLHGRVVPVSMFHIDQPKADVWSSRVFNTLGPWKLYRKSLIENMRFSEKLCVREDELFVSECMFKAEVISVASDYNYYYVEQREDATNLTARAESSFEDRFEVFEKLIAIIEAADPCSFEKAEKVVFPQLLRSSWLSCLASIEQSPEAYKRKKDKLVRLRDASEVVLSDAAIESLPPALQMVCLAFRDYDDLFALGMLSQIDLTHNGSFLGHVLPEKDCFITQNGDIEWTATVGLYSRVLNVTRCIPFDYCIESVVIRDKRIIICGSYEPNDFWIAEDSNLLLQGDDNNGRIYYTVPCVVDRIENRRVFWTARVILGNVETIFPEEIKQLHFGLSIFCRGYSRLVRFGSKVANEETRSVLFGWKWPMAGKTSVLVPISTLMGNLIVRKKNYPLDYEITKYSVSKRILYLCGTIALADCWDSSTRFTFIVSNRQALDSYTVPIEGIIKEKTLEWSIDLMQFLMCPDAQILFSSGGDIDFFIMAESKVAIRKKRFGSEFPMSLVSKISGRYFFPGFLHKKCLKAYFTSSGNLSMKKSTIVRGVMKKVANYFKVYHRQ